MRKLLRKPSPALAVACLALFVAGTGTGVAVTSALPANSVGTAQLKNGAVNSSKVKDHSLMAADFASGQLSKGAVKTLVIRGLGNWVGTESWSYAEADCPSGMVATGGSGAFLGNPPNAGDVDGVAHDTWPIPAPGTPPTGSFVPHGWAEFAEDRGAVPGGQIQAEVFVVCAPAATT